MDNLLKGRLSEEAFPIIGMSETTSARLLKFVYLYYGLIFISILSISPTEFKM